MSAVFTMQQRGWDAYAGKLGVELMQNTQKFLDWLCGQVEGEFILDADCGQAAILMLLAREGKNVVGLSSDAAILGQARAFIADEPSQVQRNITLHSGSLLDVNALIDRSFDTILLPQSIALTTQPEDSIEVAFRKLKPGGRLISLWPFGALSPSGSGYYLREPANLLARHFETTLVRLFGDTMAIICKPRAKVLERLPTIAAWPDDVIQEAESALTASQMASKAQLNTTQGELRELKRELARASTELETLSQLQAQHESHATTLKAQLEAIQHAERDAVASAQEELGRLKEQLKECQAAAESAKHAASQVQAQSRILELEKAQEIAVLRHEKLQRDVTIQEARREAELKNAQTQTAIQDANNAVAIAQAARDDALQRLHAGEAAATAMSDSLRRQLEVAQSALLAKQREIDSGQQRIVALAALAKQHEDAVAQLRAELGVSHHQQKQMLNDKQHSDALNAAQKKAESEAWAKERASFELSLNALNTQLLQARAAQQDSQVNAASKLQEHRRHLSDVESKLSLTTAQLKDAQIKGRQFLEQFRGSQAQEKEAFGKIRHLERRIRTLELQKQQALQQVEQTRKTLSFQLGYALLHAFKSWSSFVGLPGELIRIHKDGKARRERKRLKQLSPTTRSAKCNTPPKSTAEPSIKASTLAGLTGTHSLLHKQKLKVAGIMDEFTYHSYAPECDLLQLRPDTWQAQIDQFKPDLIFVESAWKGEADSWKGIISNCATEISDLLAYGKNLGIPSVFWNKEDPVHFSTFIPVAALVDHVFTTDVDCLPKYKAALGHDRVSLLPFAAQPKTHNPVEKFERKDAFNFAGSYYLRYPERQRDFAALIDTVSSLKPVEIYDRNYDNPHPHYEFPEKYSSMILGSLPFSEIDRAYKGYRYGVNMNTIKQSQTMFARRVFELLASNTVVVSNFSRGVRVMFGDLVVCSDEAGQIWEKLEPICGNELTYRKFRLQGLRKVMSQHTYRQRLQYIKTILSGQPFDEKLSSVLIIAHAADEEQLRSIVESFNSQKYAAKSLYIAATFKPLGYPNQENLRVYSSESELLAELRAVAPSFDLIGRMNPEAFYGPSYITDLALASEYSNSSAFTKAAHYTQDESGHLNLLNDGQQYKHISEAEIERSLFNISKLGSLQIQAISNIKETTLSIDALAIDEFNYCALKSKASISAQAQSECSDIEIVNCGASFRADLIPISDKIKNTLTSNRDTSSTLPRISAEGLHAILPLPASKQIQIGLKDGKLRIKSSLPPEKFAYVYATKIFSRAELNLVLNSHFHVVTADAQEIKSVFEFQDAVGKKISHQMNLIGGAHTLAIPPNCEKIRFGFRIQGNGSANIEELVLGSNGEPPATLVSRSPYLVLTKQYPAYDDLYRYGFLHTRVRSYRDAGLDVDIFRLTSSQEMPYREFENVDVASGDLELLDQTIASGQYKKVLVHLLDEKMWSVLEKHLDKIQVDIWIHGAEIQVWQRREFEFERLSKDEITRQKKLSDKRVKFWKRVLAQPQPHKNVHLIFVSQYFADEVATDLGIRIPIDSYSIIHNYIDSDIFNFQNKSAELRKSLLSIRPYASRKYANDLTVSCILELSKRPIFSDLTFNLYGDGELFEDTIAPIKHFPNVQCHRQFLSQKEISAIHKTHGIFMTPTRMDAQGVSRDEAMSSGLVAITNAVAAIPEFVDNECGYAVPGENFVAMADAVEEMYNAPELFLRKSESASIRVRRQCGFDATIAKEIKLITAPDQA